MAKKRNINAVDWIKRATAAQLEKMRAALAEVPGQVEEVVSGATGVPGLLVGDIPRAYALVPARTDGGIPAWHLMKIAIEGDRVARVEKGVQNLRGVLLQEIEDDILRDA